MEPRRADDVQLMPVLLATSEVKTLKRFFWIALLLTFPGVSCFAQEVVRAPEKYELKLVYVFEHAEAEFIFVIGNSGFKSVDRLKQFLGGLPKGSEITWAPGCDRLGNEPLLSSEKDMKSFRSFLERRGIKFVLVPAG